MPPKRKRSGRDSQGRAVKASANSTPARPGKRNKTPPAKPRARPLPPKPPTAIKNGRQQPPQTVADSAALGLRRSARIAALNARAKRDKAAAMFVDDQQNSAPPEQPAEPSSGAQQLEQESELTSRVRQLEQALSVVTAEREDLQTKLRQDSELAPKIEQLEQELAVVAAERQDYRMKYHEATQYQAWLTCGPLSRSIPNKGRLYRAMSALAAEPVYYIPGIGNTAVFMTELWKKLICDIRWVSELFLPSRVSWDSFSPEAKEKLLLWTPKAAEFLDSDDESARVVFEAWIWHILYDNVLSDLKGPWLAKHWELYDELERTISQLAGNRDTDSRENIRYHIWRNLTLGLIQTIEKPASCWTRKDPRLVIDIIMEELGPFFRLREHGTDADLDKQLLRIAKFALEVDMAKHFTRAEWIINFGHPETGALFGFPFDHRFMKNGVIMWSTSDEETDGIPVDLITSPTVVMRGIEHGFAFHDVWRDDRLFMHGIVDMTFRAPRRATNAGDPPPSGSDDDAFGSGDMSTSRPNDNLPTEEPGTGEAKTQPDVVETSESTS
ncbi:hypothetical protein B0J18DRAFT_494808 [Chaetomium sp. MPI-SDFR-AT-0129]|nr:hypothetical protein B0J18DRAFT_494808 [Chaetomium sp. MPI-SDFR-AT-0129]